MSGYGFFRSLQMMLGLGAMVLGGVVFFAFNIYLRVASEVRYRNRFGADWQAEFEKDFGSVAAEHTRIALCLFGIVAICALLVWLYRALRPGRRSHGRRRKSHKRRHNTGSPLERHFRYRRNAVVGVYFGVIGIAAGVFVIIFRLGIFPDHADEVLLGIPIFLAGYCGVLAGCWSWLKAKGWSEAIVFIGLMPLMVVFIPFVRIIAFRTALLPIAMVMMPLILIVVVFVLPDKSGIPKGNLWRRRSGNSGVGSMYEAQRKVPWSLEREK